MTGHASLEVADYRELVDLDRPPNIVPDPDWIDELERVLGSFGQASIGSTADDLGALHAALAPLEPGAIDDETAAHIERVLAGAAAASIEDVVSPLTVPTIGDLGAGGYRSSAETCLWVGDITRLRADAVVNAANSTLLGCRIPYHFCIDYALHAAAGPRLRADCARLIEAQGGPEPVGSAKITRAYALPARYVLHTVGPQLRSGTAPRTDDVRQLRSCYESCLDVAAEVDEIRTVGFCAISTGVFAFPKPEAAEIALGAVDDWLGRRPGRFDRVVFNLYSDGDAAHYRRSLGVGN